MKLLILTQKVDINDDLLGFMHGWIGEFAKYYESVIIICLQKGEYDLPENVKVLSLGKEELGIRKWELGIWNKVRYIFNFYKYIWRERKNYDRVFAHMNKEYVVLGGVFWKIWGKKTALWYNHLKGNVLSKAAGFLADKIFFTSPFSFFSKWEKAQIMPVGIDMEIFKRDKKINRIKNSFLYLGRISPVKNVDVLIRAAVILDKQGVDFILDIVGGPGEKDGEYFKEVKNLATGLKEKGKIRFLSNISNYKTPEIYNQHEIFINLTNPGSMDKTTLEAMACESLVLASNKSFEKIFPPEWHSLMLFKEKDERDLAEKIIKLLNLNGGEKEKIMEKNRELIVKNHSLKKLVGKIMELNIKYG